MKIKSITVGKLTIPLTRPFITAIRRTDNVEDIVVQIKTNCGHIGYGSAAATPLITGDSIDSIIGAIKNNIAPKLIGKDITGFNQLIEINQHALQKNTSAKAAIDIALHDLFSKKCSIPLYQFLGGNKNQVKSCITISVKDKDEMAKDAVELVLQGFTTLKIKVGLDLIDDLERVKAVYNAVHGMDPSRPQARVRGNDIRLVVDANQGWDAKGAIQIIRQMETQKLRITFVEQPVTASDITNLKFIHDNVATPIFADESCFSVSDALNIAKLNAVSGVNIKLMKCAGIQNAQAIYNIAKTANMQVMVGCMLESPIGVAAMASFAASKPDIYFADLDPIALIKHNPLIGGATFTKDTIVLSDKPGLGIEGLGNSFELIYEINQ
ncbi:MAG: L-Ala-D/L-Glu epimerase [Burkholderiales bacterium]|jgi:L-alanine-DL-glutamate epimerase-like enolase superfamily enzyme|nr:L-Ala-D/L-Glu epimerase [Burkholderiales bacterium]